MPRHSYRVLVLVAASALCLGCGSSSDDETASTPEAAPTTTAQKTTVKAKPKPAPKPAKPAATVKAVKLGMTKAQVTKLLGPPDSINELYGLEDIYVDWLWDLDEGGKSSVTFSKSGKVTRAHYCPHGVCEYVISIE